MKELQKANVKLMVATSLALGHELPHSIRKGKYFCKKCGGHLIVGDMLVNVSNEVLRPCGSEYKTGDGVRNMHVRRALSLALFDRDSVELPSNEMLESYDFEMDKLADRISGGD